MPQTNPFENHNKDEKRLISSVKEYTEFLEKKVKDVEEVLLNGNRTWEALEILKKEFK